MTSWYLVLTGIVLLIAAYFLVYPQSLFYAAIVGVIGIYALIIAFDLSGLLQRLRKK